MFPRKALSSCIFYRMLKQKLDEVRHVIDVVETLTSRRTPGVEIELIMFKEVEDIYRKVDAFPLDLEDEKTALISVRNYLFCKSSFFY